MKPNPYSALANSRKSIVAIGALVLVAIVNILSRLTPEEKATASAAVTALAWQLMSTIAREDVARASAVLPEVLGAPSFEAAPSRPPEPPAS
jgi:hypothetical protein